MLMIGTANAEFELASVLSVSLDCPVMGGEAEETITIRDQVKDDAEAIVRIYNHYIEHTDISFEEKPLVVSEIERRMRNVRSASLPWLVADANDQVLGYAYAGPWKERSAYRFSVEVAVYIDANHLGKGIGSMLYGRLFSALQKAGVHVVIAGIALPNPASVGLHEKFGLTKVAHFKEVGFKFNRWIDVGYWQRTV